MTGFIIFLLCLLKMFMSRAELGLQELATDTYHSTLLPGRTSLLYFTRTDSPRNNHFLEEFKKSAEALQDYSIFVAKVNCMTEDMPKCCSNENVYLFRGTKLLREFPTDTLFNVNAIVANVLFVLLYNEVKYITSTSEFQNIESTMKGKKNVVFVYVRAIGMPEHRSVMEVAYVYGSMYQFVLSTETALLENISAGHSDPVPGMLVYCHCKVVTNPAQKCHRTLSDQPLSTLSIHRFLKLMDAPLVAEVSGDIDKVTSVHLQLGLPMIIMLSQQETYEADRATAEDVAWQLLGKAGLAILAREKTDPRIPLNTNVAVKRAEENEPVTYMMLQKTQEIIDLIQNTKNQQNKESEEETIYSDQEAQDDEVAEAVYRDRKRVLPLDLVTPLTDETFQMVATSRTHTVVLFYASWEAVSVTFLQSFVEMAVKYNDSLNVNLARINCEDWPHLCNQQNITSIPIAKIYQHGRDPLPYTGMMGAEGLAKFIQLSKLDCPLHLYSTEDAERYLNGTLYGERLPSHLSALGILTPSMKAETEAFTDAGKSLQGMVSLGIYSGEQTSLLTDKYGIPPPAILFSRPNQSTVQSVSLLNVTTSTEIIQLIKKEMLGVFPEITVENFPSIFPLQKPLLVLFSNGRLDRHDEEHILRLVRGKYLEPYLTCWMNVQNTPVANEILKKYFGLIPSLPLLVIIHFDALGQAFAFPSDQHLTEVNILYWLEMIKAGAELPVYSLSKEEWKARLPDYDFLAIMDAADPDFAAQKIRIRMKSGKSKKMEVPVEGRLENVDSSSLRGTVPKFLEKGKKGSNRHQEL
ncbi:thioredoxin domain-containing protein 16 [Pelodytes ibericus]